MKILLKCLIPLKAHKSSVLSRNLRRFVIHHNKRTSICYGFFTFQTRQELRLVDVQGELFEVRALHYLHSNRIIHRDMKPQNILIGAGSVVKVRSGVLPLLRIPSYPTLHLHFCSSFPGTPLYMAPELVREQPYNHSADLWSLGVILYELFVGQPPFYTNSVYALIRHIVKDPVKYPDDMSLNFKSFLKGLPNKVPQNRLSWPMLLDHPFVKETSEELDGRVMCAATSAPRECDAARRGEENNMQASTGRSNSVAALENCNPPKSHSDADLNCPNAVTGSSSPQEEFPGFASPNDVKQSGNQILDRLESNSLTVKGANIIGQDNEALTIILLPLRKWSKESLHSWRKKEKEMGVENYHVIEVVGEGSFGKVYKGRRKYTGQVRYPSQQANIYLLWIFTFQTRQELRLVDVQGELFEVRALHYLHSNRIIHRDMKPQNILIGAGSVVKVRSGVLPLLRIPSYPTLHLHFCSSFPGTPLYMAPELVREQPYNHSADLWSLGVILYELFVGQPPFYTNSVYALIRHIVKGLLNKVPQNRLSWPMLLDHPFVKETSEELDGRVMCAATSAPRECDAARRGEENNMQASTGLIASNPRENEIDWDQDVLTTTQSPRIISNLAAAGATGGLVNEILSELLNFTANVVSLKSSELSDLLAKSFSIIKLQLDNIGSAISTSYFKHWVALAEIFSQMMVLKATSLTSEAAPTPERSSLVGTDSARIIEAVTRAFLRSKAVQVAIFYCLKQRIEPALSASIQILSRCCLHNAMVPGVLCGLPSSLPVTTVVKWWRR
ncbi:hypothetical protein D5086_033303 [Populus alba]|uniref:Uncharacterized protein n=1 Tax=Populus alba TaxID=43335 RepID=A0ACC4AGH0_POPAL